MQPSAKDKVEGKYHEVKGTIKEKAGKVTKNPILEAEGKDEKKAGKAQRKTGRMEKAIEKWRSRMMSQQF